MTLAAAAAANRAALVAQLYDQWGGYYVVQRVDAGEMALANPAGYCITRLLNHDEPAAESAEPLTSSVSAIDRSRLTEESSVWLALQAALQSEMTRATYETWIVPCRLFSDGARWFIGAPNAYALEFLRDRLHATVRRLLSSLLSVPVDIDYITIPVEES